MKPNGFAVLVDEGETRVNLHENVRKMVKWSRIFNFGGKVPNKRRIKTKIVRAVLLLTDINCECGKHLTMSKINF